MGLRQFVLPLIASCFCLTAVAQNGTQKSTSTPSPKKHNVAAKKKPLALDHSGKPRHGKASYYAHSFAGKKMADGTPMNPKANIAASKTLPLGTTAKVTNLENGKSQVVEIRDRGPYVDGRIVDLSPGVADKLGIREQGVAPVVVAPLKVPQADGSVKMQAAADSTTLQSSGE